MNPIKRKILVVDDNIEFAKTVARNLEKEGFQISLASDGNAAILAASNESPDLVLLDLKLPDIPGVQLLRIMKWSRSSRGTATADWFFSSTIQA